MPRRAAHSRALEVRGLLLLALAAAAPLALPAGSFALPRFPAWSRRSSTPRSGAAPLDAPIVDTEDLEASPFEASAVADMRVQQVKAELKRKATVEAVLALERMWRPAHNALKDLSTLEGQWELRGPPQNLRGWMAGDVFRMIFNLYQGGLGKMLRMEIESAPEVVIDASGHTETLSRLKWGLRQDDVKVLGSLKLVGPNTIQEQRRSVKSSALRLTVPAVQRPRLLKVTYFDGEVLVLRDSHGVVDVLWRADSDLTVVDWNQVESTVPVRPGESVVLEEPPEQVAAVGTQAKGLLGNVEALKQSLQEQREKAASDRAERLRLQQEIARLEKALADVGVESKAHAAKLGVLATLKDEISSAAGDQQDKRRRAEAEHVELAAEVAALGARAKELEEQLGKQKLRDASLRSQIPLLEAEFRTAPRSAWPGYRAAIDEAKAELKELVAQASGAKKELAGIRRDLARKESGAQRREGAARAEALAYKSLEEQLEERAREFHQAEALGAGVSGKKQQLIAELTATEEKLSELEARESWGREKATAVEAEIDEIIAQAQEAQKLGKSLQKSQKKRAWPWR